MLTVNYEDLCKDPNGEINRIHTWCRTKGIKTKVKYLLPEFYNTKKVDLKSDIDAIKIKDELDFLESINGPLKN